MAERRRRSTTVARGVLALAVTVVVIGTLTVPANGAVSSAARPADVRAAAVPVPVNLDVDGEVYALARHANTVYLGGSFTSVGGLPRSNLAAISLTSQHVIDWAPQVTGSSNPVVRAIAVDVRNSTVFFGGKFDSVNGTPRHNVAAVSNSFGDLTAWDPQLTDGPAGGEVHALAVQFRGDGLHVFIGGAFGGVRGQPRTGLAESIGQLSGAPTSWNPVLGGSVADGAIVTSLAVHPLGQTVYAGGDFTRASGRSRPHLAAFDTAAGGVPTAWNPGADSYVHGILLDAPRDVLYAAGSFFALGGSFRARAGAVSTAGQGPPTSWRDTPDAYACAPGPASLAESPDGTEVYVGCGNSGPDPLHAFRADTGQMIRSYPVDGTNGGTVDAVVATTNGSVVAGGSFGATLFPAAEPPELPDMMIGSSTVEEGDTGARLARVTVTLSKPVSFPTAATYVTSPAWTNVVATSGSDYATKEGMFVIPAGATSAMLSFKVYGDLAVEQKERFLVVLQNPQAVVIKRSPGTVIITDDDRSPERRISIGDAYIGEGDVGTRLARFTVSVSRPSNDPVSVVYVTVPGTATPGEDYTPRWAVATVRPRTMSTTVTVPVMADTRDEPAETYTVRLFQPHGAVLGGRVATGQIFRDDGPF